MILKIIKICEDCEGIKEIIPCEKIIINNLKDNQFMKETDEIIKKYGKCSCDKNIIKKIEILEEHNPNISEGNATPQNFINQYWRENNSPLILDLCDCDGKGFTHYMYPDKDVYVNERTLFDFGVLKYLRKIFNPNYYRVEIKYKNGKVEYKN